jgi:hypothetical protein
MEKGWFIGNGGETRLIIRHRQAFHQFPKRYHLPLDFLKNPFTLVHKGVPSRIYAPGDARS